MQHTKLTILSVAFPLAPVTADPVGGAEQILAHLDRALVSRGHRSIVIAPEGSRVAGELRPVPAIAGPIGEPDAERVRTAVRTRIAEAIERDRPEIIHLHGLDFDAYLPEAGPSVLVTLHLPLDWYAEGALRPARPDVCLHPVSRSQAARCPACVRLADPIENGVALPAPTARKRRFALAIGRICPEKGFEDALAAAEVAHIPLLLAGSVFPYPDHERHFRSAILPCLGWRRRWIGPIAGDRKARLLGEARCVLIPSKAPETSSLVAMEALAAGTPVIAYPSGALPDIVEHGRTGFLADGVAGMAAAIARIGEIDSAECRRQAARRFSADRMIEAYLTRYAELAAR